MGKKGYSLLGTIMVLAALCAMPEEAFAGMYGRADLSYQKTVTTTEGVISDDTSSFQQGYTLGFTKNITSTISLGGDLRFIINESDGEKTDDVYPLFYLNFTPPPIFNFSFSHNRTESAPTGVNPTTSGYTSASLSVPSQRYPSLSLAYNRQTTQDYLSPHELDTVSSSASFITSYSKEVLGFANTVSYNFAYSSNEDNVSSLSSSSPSHSANATVARSFWDDKIRAEANVGYSLSDTKSESSAGPTRFEQEEPAIEGLYSSDSSPSTDLLTSTPALIDNDTSSSTGVDLNGTYRNIGVRFPFSETIHKIYIYINTTDTNIANYTVTWELYTSADGISWTLYGNPTVTYESAYSRYVLSFPETTATYFKVVNTTYPVGAFTINITEIEALGYLLSTAAETVESSSQRDFGGFKVSFMPIERMTIGHNLNYDHSTQDLGGTDTKSVSNSTGLNLVVLPKYLTMFASYTLTGLETTGTDSSTGVTETDETGSSGYSLTFSATPLKTLSASLNLSSGESVSNGVKTTQSSSLSGDVFMHLYTGVDVKVGGSLSSSESFVSASTTDAIYYYTNLSLIPWKPVTVFINLGATSSTTESDGASTDTSDSTLQTSVTYSPTRKLYLTASVNVEPTASHTYTVTVLPSANSQAWASYGFTEDMTNMGLNISFSPFTSVSMQFGINSTTTESIDSTVDSAYMKLSVSL